MEKNELFYKINKNEDMNEPKDLYVLAFEFDLPIARSAYKKEKTEALELDYIEKDPKYITHDLTKCVYGELLMVDFAESAKLQEKHGMKFGKFDLDADYYTLQWDFNRADSNNHLSRSFVTCEQSFDIDENKPGEIEKNRVNFYVSIANEDKTACYKEIKEIYDSVKEYGKDSLRNEKDLNIQKGIEEKFKKIEKELGLDKGKENNANEVSKNKVSLKVKSNNHGNTRKDDFEK